MQQRRARTLSSPRLNNNNRRYKKTDGNFLRRKYCPVSQRSSHISPSSPTHNDHSNWLPSLRVLSSTCGRPSTACTQPRQVRLTFEGLTRSNSDTWSPSTTLAVRYTDKNIESSNDCRILTDWQKELDVHLPSIMDGIIVRRRKTYTFEPVHRQQQSNRSKQSDSEKLTVCQSVSFVVVLKSIIL